MIWNEKTLLAYRKLAQEYHPDKHDDAEVAQTKMSQINLAYEVLSDEGSFSPHFPPDFFFFFLIAGWNHNK